MLLKEYFNINIIYKPTPLSKCLPFIYEDISTLYCIFLLCVSKAVSLIVMINCLQNFTIDYDPIKVGTALFKEN